MEETMFAVIKTGGKQYRVSEGDELTVEKLAAAPGDRVQFNDVLMLGGGETRLGAPYIEDAGVTAEVLEQARGPKVWNFKKRRRKHSSKRLKGHRQDITRVRIDGILPTGAGASGVTAALGAGSVPKEQRPVPQAAPEEASAGAPPPPGAQEATPVRPGNLLDAPEGEADDLTKMAGVGPKLSEKLNAAGVHHFAQIAAWGPGEVAYMDAELELKGRIARDDWVGQAAGLAAGDE
jgi:large subunit ribosomal protein L21